MTAQKAPTKRPAYMDPTALRLAKNVRVESAPDDEQAEFEESIKLHGVLQAVTVQINPEDNAPEVVDGQRRWNAALKFGHTSIPVQWRAFGTDDENAVIQLVLNLQRSGMTLAETAAAVWDLFNGAAGGSQTMIAEMLGKPKSWVSRHMKLGADVPEAHNTVARDLMVSGYLSDADMGETLCKIEELSLAEAQRIGKEISDYAHSTEDKPKGLKHDRKTLKTALDQLRKASSGTPDDYETLPPTISDQAAQVGIVGGDEGDGPTSVVFGGEDLMVLDHILTDAHVPTKWLERLAAMRHAVSEAIATVD